MPLALSVYAYLNAKLKARISKMLPDETLEALIRAKSLPEAALLLRGTYFEPLEAAYSSTGDLRAGEAILYASEIELYTELMRHVKEPVLSFVRALSLRYEIENLKNAIRLWYDGTVRGRGIEGKSSYLYRKPILHEMNVDALIGAPDIASLAEALEGTPYADIAEEQAPRVLSKKSLFPLEVALDRYYYATLLGSIPSLSARDSKIASRLSALDVDIQNISWIARFKNFYNLPAEEALSYLIPWGSGADMAKLASAYATGSTADIFSAFSTGRFGYLQALLGKGSDSAGRLLLLERALHQLTLSEVGRLLSGNPFTIGTLLAYCILRKNEIASILTILNAKYYRLPDERIRNAL